MQTGASRARCTRVISSPSPRCWPGRLAPAQDLKLEALPFVDTLFYFDGSRQFPVLMRSCLISQSAFLQPCLHPSLLMLFTRLVISTYARPLSLKLSDLRSQSATYFNDSDSMTPESKCDAVSGRWNQYCTFFALPGDYESPNCTKAVKNKPNGFDLSP